MTKKTSRLFFKRLKLSWQKALMRLTPLGAITTNNSLQIFHDGDEAFEKILDVIGKARTSIVVETYIFAQDAVGLLVRDALILAAKRDVRVILIYDHFGTGSLGRAFVRPMRDAGITILEFNPIWPWRRRGPLLFRDHRKLIIVDEAIAFCGSMNISVDYAGPRLGRDVFRDSIALVEGPAVLDLLHISNETILESEFQSKKETEAPVLHQNPSLVKLLFHRLLLPPKLVSPHVPKDGTAVQILPSNQRRHLTYIQKSLEECINRAVDYCYFTTPYFLPYPRLARALINAKKRGVDVRILTAGISDVPLMRLANHHVYGKFLENGIRIYEMTQKKLHAKLATVDGVYSSIGSYNLDYWSARRNLEVNLSAIDRTIAMELKTQFHKDLQNSVEIKYMQFHRRGFIRKWVCLLAYLLFRL